MDGWKRKPLLIIILFYNIFHKNNRARLVFQPSGLKFQEFKRHKAPRTQGSYWNFLEEAMPR